MVELQRVSSLGILAGSVSVIELVPAAEKAAAKKGVKYKERQAHKASFKA